MPPVYSKPKEANPPPYPPQNQGFPPGYPGGQQGGAYPPYPPRPAYPPYPGGYPPYPPAGNQPAATSYGGYPPYPPQAGPTAQQPGYYNQASTASTDTSSSSSGTITQEHIKASILSAVEDKVRRRIRDEFSTRGAETDSLKKIGEDLTAGKARLEQMMQKLQDESAELDRSIKTLEDKQTEMSDLVAKLEESAEIDVDEAVVASAPLFKQLFAAYAEESATEDALYFLGEALRRGVIDCDVFLKHVRNLSRRQFMLRATMQKCRQKAGLEV